MVFMIMATITVAFTSCHFYRFYYPIFIIINVVSSTVNTISIYIFIIVVNSVVVVVAVVIVEMVAVTMCVTGKGGTILVTS